MTEGRWCCLVTEGPRWLPGLRLGRRMLCWLKREPFGAPRVRKGWGWGFVGCWNRWKMMVPAMMSGSEMTTTRLVTEMLP